MVLNYEPSHGGKRNERKEYEVHSDKKFSNCAPLGTAEPLWPHSALNFTIATSFSSITWAFRSQVTEHEAQSV